MMSHLKRSHPSIPIALESSQDGALENLAKPPKRASHARDDLLIGLSFVNVTS